MSYCRFSEDSDVYVYQSFNYMIVHVANNRGCIPEGYKGSLDTTKKFFTPIGLPSDGEEYHADSPSACIKILTRLKSEGYKIPQRALDRLRGDSSKQVLSISE